MILRFFGLEFGFGLQPGNTALIKGYPGTADAAPPIRQLAGPVTGLIIPPIKDAVERYLAYVAGRFNRDQHRARFLAQSAFTRLARRHLAGQQHGHRYILLAG